MIVADATLVSYLVIPGGRTAEAERVRASEKEWVAPPLFPHELLNVMAKHVRLAGMARDRAIRLYRRGLSIVSVDTSLPDPADVLRLAEQSGCTSYDLEYVWLAIKKLGVRLVTSDKQVLDAYPDVAFPMDVYK